MVFTPVAASAHTLTYELPLSQNTCEHRTNAPITKTLWLLKTEKKSNYSRFNSIFKGQHGRIIVFWALLHLCHDITKRSTMGAHTWGVKCSMLAIKCKMGKSFLQKAKKNKKRPKILVGIPWQWWKMLDYSFKMHICFVFVEFIDWQLSHICQTNTKLQLALKQNTWKASLIDGNKIQLTQHLWSSQSKGMKAWRLLVVSLSATKMLMSLQPVCMNVRSLEELLALCRRGHSSQHSCHCSLPSFPLCQPLHSPYRAMEARTPTLKDLSINRTTTPAVRGNRLSAI